MNIQRTPENKMVFFSNGWWVQKMMMIGGIILIISSGSFFISFCGFILLFWSADIDRDEESKIHVFSQSYILQLVLVLLGVSLMQMGFEHLQI
jgi:hypothetical protein